MRLARNGGFPRFVTDPDFRVLTWTEYIAFVSAKICGEIDESVFRY